MGRNRNASGTIVTLRVLNDLVSRGRGISVRLGIAALVSVAAGLALPPIIGVASALGTFTVNNAEVQGNANLFDGAQLKTSKASSRIFMQNGASLVLGIDSVATIYADHIELQQGAAKVDNMAGFSIRARDYRIVSAQSGSQAIVRITAAEVQVAALTGSLNVFDSSGVLLTRITNGTAAAFSIAASGASAGPAVHGARRNNNNVERRDAALLLLILAAAALLGLFVDSISQASPTSP